MVQGIVKLMFLAIIGSLIGWITNKIAIKLLFRPLEPFKIPIFNINIQGLIPKRKSEIAKVIGDTVEKELLSFDEIIEKTIEKQDFETIKSVIKIKLKSKVAEKLPILIPDMFKNMILSYIDEFVEEKGEDILLELSENVLNNAKEKVSISRLVEDKLNAYDMVKIENIVISIAKKELKHIEILGGILGFIIGLFQGAILLLK